MIIGIETSTEVCSAALFGGDGDVVAIRENKNGDHASQLGVYIEELLKETRSVDAVAVSAGPGSYTGLRIGVSTAKGLCYALGVPMIAVGSLDSLAWQAAGSVDESAVLCPMIDARRMEVYTQCFDSYCRPLTPVRAEIIDAEWGRGEWSARDFYIFGSGAAKCRDVLPWAHFIDISASARGLAVPALRAFAEDRFVDTAYFEPLYLKDFVATTPKKRVGIV